MASSKSAAGAGLTVLAVEGDVDKVDIYAPVLRDRFPGMRVLCAKDAASLEAQVGEADIVFAAPTYFPVHLFEKANRLRWFQNTGAGVDKFMPVRDKIDHITITNARGVVADIITDFVMGAVTALHWDFAQFKRDQSNKEWNQRWVSTLSERTVGIVGLGAIGSAIARRAKSSGMTVVGLKRDASQPVAGVDKLFGPEGLADLLKVSDFLVLAVPRTSETTRIIGREQFQLMRRGASLVNISRGGVVVESDLIEALNSGVLSGAFLDVFEREPLPPDSPLWTMPNVMVTPHTVGFVEGYADRVLDLFTDNIQRFIENKPLRNLIDLKRGY